MARQIKIEQIGKFMNDQVEQLVRATTLEWEARVKVRTPVDTNRLRNGWQHSISGLSGEVFNSVEYAEPVCFGTALPPSWGGEYRTTQATVPGFPDLIGKELESWAQQEYQKIVRRG
jgi:hypothetical protein